MAEAAPFGEAAPALATEAAKREAILREIAYRRRVFPRLVAKGRMTEAKAQHEIWIFERILAEGYQP